MKKWILSASFWLALTAQIHAQEVSINNFQGNQIFHDAKGGILISNEVALDSFKGKLTSGDLKSLHANGIKTIKVDSIELKSFPKTIKYFDPLPGTIGHPISEILKKKKPMLCDPRVCNPGPFTDHCGDLPCSEPLPVLPWKWQTTIYTQAEEGSPTPNPPKDPNPTPPPKDDATCLAECNDKCVDDNPACDNESHKDCFKRKKCTNTCLNTCK